jgi:hypothetical protein
VFVTYFLIGLGLFSFLAWLGQDHLVTRVAVVLALVMALWMIKDILLPGRGPTMAAPHATHGWMQRAMQRGGLAGMLIAGALVGICTVPCSGAIYLDIVAVLHASGGGITGFALLALYAAHNKHAGHDPAVFRRQFWIVLALTLPVVAWSAEVQRWLGYQAPVFPGSDLIPALLGTGVFAYGGRVFLVGALSELRDRLPGMMTLISLAVVVAFVASWAATLGLFDIDVWWELATLITVMSLGHWLEMRSIMQAQGALSALAELLPDSAERVTDGGTETVPLADVTAGDVVLVRPGARVPADGVVVEGSADVDESMITGESRPVPKEPGAKVVAGTVAAGGSLRVRVTAVGEQTALSGIMRLVAEAQASNSRAQVLADRAAALLFFVALGSGLVTLAIRPSSALPRSSSSPVPTPWDWPSRWSSPSAPPWAPATGCWSGTGWRWSAPGTWGWSSSTRPAPSRVASRPWPTSSPLRATPPGSCSPWPQRWRPTPSTHWPGRWSVAPSSGVPDPSPPPPSRPSRDAGPALPWRAGR